MRNASAVFLLIFRRGLLPAKFFLCSVCLLMMWAPSDGRKGKYAERYYEFSRVRTVPVTAAIRIRGANRTNIHSNA